MLLKILAIAGVAGAMVAPVALAEDASFGCQVLLCAASSNPSWSSVPYCVPVMHRLFDLLAAGHSWPTCPEGMPAHRATSRLRIAKSAQCWRPVRKLTAAATTVSGNMVSNTAKSRMGPTARRQANSIPYTGVAVI